MTKYWIVLFLLLITKIGFAQYKQTVPSDFVSRMISSGKVWKAHSYGQVQVNGSLEKAPAILLLVSKDKLEFKYPDKSAKVYSYTMEPGVVDPLLKTNDGNVYEVRFFNNPPVEIMRLRRVESPEKLSYYEDIMYMH